MIIRAALLASTILWAPAFGAQIFTDCKPAGECATHTDVTGVTVPMVLGTAENDVIFTYTEEDAVLVGGPGNDNLSPGLNRKGSRQRIYCDAGPNGERSGSPGNKDIGNLGSVDVGTGCETYPLHGMHYGDGNHARVDGFRLDVSKILFPPGNVVLYNTTTINHVPLTGGMVRLTVTGVYLGIPDIIGRDIEGIGINVLVKLDVPIVLTLQQGESATWTRTIQGLKPRIVKQP